VSRVVVLADSKEEDEEEEEAKEEEEIVPLIRFHPTRFLINPIVTFFRSSVAFLVASSLASS